MLLNPFFSSHLSIVIYFWLSCKLYYQTFIILRILSFKFYFCEFYHLTFMISRILSLKFIFHEFYLQTFNISQILLFKFFFFLLLCILSLRLVTKWYKKSFFKFLFVNCNYNWCRKMTFYIIIIRTDVKR